MGATLFILLNYVGDQLYKFSFIDRIARTTSSYTYYIFLIQHRLIIKILERYNLSNTLTALAVLIGIIVTLLIFSGIFSKLIQTTLKSHLFLKFEHALMGSNA